MSIIVFQSGTNPMYVSKTTLSPKLYTKNPDSYIVDQIESKVDITPVLVLNPIESYDV